jgi:hypothetical protein
VRLWGYARMSEPMQKKELVPRVRFPRFHGGWNHKPISSVLNHHGLRSDGESEVHSVSVHKGVVNQIEHLGRWSARLEMCQWIRETLDEESVWDVGRSTSLSR